MGGVKTVATEGSNSDSLLPSEEVFWQGQVLTSTASFLSVVGSVCVIVTFRQFPWLNKYPRNLYMWFAVSFLIDGLFTSLTVIFAYNYPNTCSHALAQRFLAHFCRICENMWVCCISHSVHSELRIRLGHLRSRSSRGMAAMYRYRLTLQARYHALSWGVPLIFTIAMMLVHNPCDFEYAGLAEVSDTAVVNAWVGEGIEGLTFLFTLLLFVWNIGKARFGLSALDIGLGGSIESSSITRPSVYMGMFFTFGVFRLPHFVLNVIMFIYMENEALVISRDNFWRLWLASLIFNPIIGFCNFVWLAYKFKFWVLWRNHFYRLRGQSIDSPLIETFVGIY